MSDDKVQHLARLLDCVVAQTEFVVETLRTGDMELKSNRQLGRSNTVEKRVELNAEGLRKLYGDIRNSNPNVRVTISAGENESNHRTSLEELIFEVSRLHVVCNRKIGHALPDIIEGPANHTINENGLVAAFAISEVSDFAKYLVLQSALFGSEAIATTLIEWSQGKDLVYEMRALLGGIKIDNLIQFDGGVRFERLPNQVSELPHRLPGFASIAQSDYLGRVMLVVDCHVTPALWNPEERPKIRTDWALGSHSIRGFCEALSVICDSEVQDLMSWEDYGHAAVFRASTGISVSTRRDKASLRHSDIQVGQPEIRQAFDLLDRTKDEKSLQIGISHWVKSKGRMLNDVERLIYLRTALEALLLPAGSRSELRFRLALHGARLLELDKEERKVHFRKLKKFYDLASKAVHGGEIKRTEENRELLDFGQDFCRKAIIRSSRLAKVDWEAILLGG